MSSNLVQVNWETHKKLLFDSLGTLRNKEIHTDITLSCEGKLFPAHRLVLIMCSGYFSKALQIPKLSSTSLVLICGIKSFILEALLNFIYNGTTAIKSNNVPDLLKAGLLLEIPGLMEMGNSYIATRSNANIENDPIKNLKVTNISSLSGRSNENLKGIGDMCSPYYKTKIKTKTELTTSKETIKEKENCGPFQPIVMQGRSCTSSKPTVMPERLCSSPKPTVMQEIISSPSKPTVMLQRICLPYKPTELQQSIHSPSKPAEHERICFPTKPPAMQERFCSPLKPTIIHGRVSSPSKPVIEQNDYSDGEENNEACPSLSKSDYENDESFSLPDLETTFPQSNIKKGLTEDILNDNQEASNEIERSLGFAVASASKVGRPPGRRSMKRNHHCTFCGKKYAKKNSLIDHLKVHDAQAAKSVACNICNKVFNNQRLFAAHVRKHKTDSLSKEENDDQNEGKNNETTVTYLKRAKEVDSSTRSERHIPGKRFKGDNQETKLHTKDLKPSLSISEMDKTKKCKNAGQENESIDEDYFDTSLLALEEFEPIFASESLLEGNDCDSDNGDEAFISSVQESSELQKSVVYLKTKFCDLCNKDFMFDYQFMNHRTSDCIILECSFCLKSFTQQQKSEYLAHVEKHSEEEKPYVCPKCYFKSDKKQNLEDHMSFHNGVFRFWCPLCDFQAKKLFELQKHTVSQHPNLLNNIKTSGFF